MPQEKNIAKCLAPNWFHVKFYKSTGAAHYLQFCSAFERF